MAKKIFSAGSTSDRRQRLERQRLERQRLERQRLGRQRLGLRQRLGGLACGGLTCGRSCALAALVAAAAALALGSADRCAASEQPQRSEPTLPTAEDLTAEHISAVRRRLSGGTFDQRQRAMWDLWRERSANREAVVGAVGDPDPEVSSRARWVMDRWRRGILPETPLELARQLETVSHSDSLQQLLDAGLFDGARVAIEEAAAADDQATLSRAAAVIQRAFPFYIRSADARDQLPQFADLIDRLASTAEMVICRDQLWALLGREAQPRQHSAGQPERSAGRQEDDRPDAQRIEVTALAAAGRLDEAFALARTAEDPELLRVCQLLRGDWAGLAQTQAEAAASAAPGSDESDRHWAYVLVAASRGGDQTLRDQAVAALSRRPSDDSPDASEDPFVRLRWQVLAMHGEIDAAVEILASRQPLVAAELLAQAGRLSDAMAVIDFDAQQADARIRPLILAARSATENWSAAQLRQVPEPLERLIAIARLLFLSGRRDAAWDLFAGVAAAPAGVQEANVALSRAFVLQALTRLNRPDWLARMVIQDEGGALSGTGRHFLSRALDVRPETIDSLALAMGQILPRSGTALAQAVIDFVGGEVPQDFNPQKDYQRLFDLLASRSPGRAALELTRTGGPAVPELNLEIAKLFELHGQIELTKKSLIQLAGSGEIEAILEFAEAELKEGRGQSARVLFETVWKRIDQQRQDPSHLNRAEEAALTAMRAILGEAVAAARLGDQEGAAQLWRLIDLMTCSPSAKLRDAFGSHLLDQGFDQQAERIFRVLLPWVAFGSDEGVEFYSVARNFNRSIDSTHPSLAADIYDLAIAGTIESTVFIPAAYVSLPAYVHRSKILAAIPQGDHEQIRHHVDAVMRLNPIDIDFGEKVIEQLREAGMTQLADETIQRIYRTGSVHLEQFPLDIVTANNLAWIMALSDHRLAEALDFARRAVYLAPDSTVYRDTLAEVLFRLGRIDEAIAIEKACLLDQPGEWHTHEQLRRFQAASGD